MSVLLAFVVGVVMVGATTERVLAVGAGRVAMVLAYSGAISIAHYAMVRYAAAKQLDEYVAFSVGAAGVSALMAWRRR